MLTDGWMEILPPMTHPATSRSNNKPPNFKSGCVNSRKNGMGLLRSKVKISLEYSKYLQSYLGLVFAHLHHITIYEDSHDNNLRFFIPSGTMYEINFIFVEFINVYSKH